MNGRYIAVPLHGINMLNITYHDVEYASSGRSAEQHIEMSGRAVAGDTVADAARWAVPPRDQMQPVLVLDRQSGSIALVYVAGMDGRVLRLEDAGKLVLHVFDLGEVK